ncbi:MAG: O-antigen ligase family protein [Betaproteobacteria bacterium]|nr:O-antigen ligase family protein [Betaproteobacteria bacterium]
MNLATQKKATSLFLVGLFLTSTLITSISADPVNIPKFVSLLVFSSITLAICLFSMNIKSIRRIGSLGVTTIIFAVALILVAINSKSDLASQLYGVTGRNIGVFSLLGLVGFMIIGFLLASEDLMEKLVLTLVAVTLLSALYGFLQYLKLDPLTWDSDYGNIFGFVGNPNFQSAMMGLGAIGCVGQLFMLNQANKWKIASVILMIMMLSSVKITGSIQGYLIFVLGLLFLLYSQFLKWAPSFLHVTFLTSILFGPFLVFLFLVNFLESSALIKEASLQQRATYWEVGVRIWNQNPIVGTGLDTFSESFRSQRNLANIEAVSGTITNSAHNFFIDLLANGGLLLFLPFLFFVIKTILAIYKALKSKKTIAIPVKIIIGVWIGLFTQMLISPNQIAIMVWFWACTGAIIGYASKLSSPENLTADKKIWSETKQNSRPTQELAPAQILAAFIGVLISLLISLPPYVASVRYLSALKSGQVERIYESASILPTDVSRSVAIIDAFSKNQFNSQAHSLALQTVERYPNSFVAWNVLYLMDNSLPSEKKKALLNMRRLDPENPQLNGE